MIPAFLKTGERESLQDAVRIGTRIALGAALVMTMILFAFGRQVLTLFGPEYADGYKILVVLTLGHLISAGAGPVGYLMSLTGHERSAAGVYGVCVCVNIVANAVLIPQYGAMGAAFATAGSMALWNAWLRALVARKLGVRSFVLGLA